MSKQRKPKALHKSLLSFVQPQVLERRRTAHNPLLQVIEVNGRRRLDGLTVNYSCGSLERVLADAFDTLELERRPIASALLLGFGAGSAVQLLRRSHGRDVRFTAVEIDPEVVELAQRWFGFDGDAGVEFVCADARAFVTTCEARFDLVLVDVFVDECVPASLHDVDFAREVGALVRPGGRLVFNTLADSIARVRESETIERALRSALGRVERLDVRTNRVFAWEAPV